MLDYSQLFLSLMMVVVFIILLAVILQKIGPHRLTQQGPIKLLSSTTVGPRERICIVQAGDLYLLVGITAHSIQTLQTLTTQQANGILSTTGKNEKSNRLMALLGAKS